MSSEDDKLAPLNQMNLERVFREATGNLTDKEAADAWAFVDAIETAAKERKAVLREALLERAADHGEAYGDGHAKIEMDGVKVFREKRVANLPDPKLVEALLKEAGLEYDDAFTPKRDWALDPSKVEFLAKCGKLPADKLDESKKVSYALKIRSLGSLNRQIEAVKKQLASSEGEG